MGLRSLVQGKQAERLAARHLRKQGLTLLALNQRYKCGEIDIIAKDVDTHIFVEVKYRKGKSYGEPAEMVSYEKQIKLAKAAKLWLQDNDPHFDFGCRFDVIAITTCGKASSGKDILWLKNAFSPELW